MLAIFPLTINPSKLGGFICSDTIPLIDINAAICGLDHQASLVWNGLSCNPRKTSSRGAKLCTYHDWFRPFKKSNPFFLFPTSGKRMQRFSRFRKSSHSLHIKQADATDHPFLELLGSVHTVHFLWLETNNTWYLNAPSYCHLGISFSHLSPPTPQQCDHSWPKRIAWVFPSSY